MVKSARVFTHGRSHASLRCRGVLGSVCLLSTTSYLRLGSWRLVNVN